ncbi:MAG: hypothetical protein AB7S26_27690 [Sandaracinaceae bacterium]
MATRKKRRGPARKTKRAEAPARPEAGPADAAPTVRSRGADRFGWLQHGIAVFVIFHILANGLSMFPDLGRALDRRAWGDPRAQAEMVSWASRFGTEPRALEDTLYAIVVDYQAIRAEVLTPFEPYMRYAGLRQSWLMFTAGTRESDRFGVRMRRCAPEDPSCEWEDLYIHADPGHDWRASQLGHPRIRSMIFRWSWPSYAEQYDRGCRAIAQLAFAEFDDARVFQCRFERTVLPTPDQPDTPEPEWGRELTVYRRAGT